MPPTVTHLPNGQNLTVTSIFGGISFRPNEQHNGRTAFPPGWAVVLNEEEVDEYGESADTDVPVMKKYHVHRYKRPTLENDHLYISSISYPSSSDFKPATSPTRQVAMMLWATLWWYFHQPEPDRRLNTRAAEKTPDEGKPRGEWKININREGIFKGKSTLQKLERMGLITSEDSSVGLDDRKGEGWTKMFVSRRAFWQIDPRIFLFTLPAVQNNSPFPGGSPWPSRPSSPTTRDGKKTSPSPSADSRPTSEIPGPLSTPPLGGPFESKSHLPTFYPPHPTQYVFTNGVKHPIRPKPFRQGETIYVRYIPSLGQYLSFRVASISPLPPSNLGPWSDRSGRLLSLSGPSTQHIPEQRFSDTAIASVLGSGPNDVELLHNWMNNPRVAHSWGEQGPMQHQEAFLRNNLGSKHSFPVIGCWDGKPFGYFEIYWVKEDMLGQHLGYTVGDWDRGIHCLVGEQDARGPHRVKVWLSALIHYCWLQDMRTQSVLMEPRVDNEKLAKYCVEAGFHKIGEVAFPHKQSNVFRIHRDSWEAPAI